ncbi:MAG: biotin--[acetyl-CoA-carboxylase] ligase [Pseudomonadota bacterium]
MKHKDWVVFEHDILPSTQDEAKKLLAAGQTPPFIVVAKHQSAGRGRAGHAWSSLPDNLQCTLVLPVCLEARHAGQYAFVIGLALADTCEHFGITDIALKWPNDVLVKGQKIAGILLESNIEADGHVSSLLIGTGVNVASAPDGATAFYLASTQKPTPLDVLSVYQRDVIKYLDMFEAGGFASIRKKWLSYAYKLGQKMKVRLPSSTFEGSFVDIGNDGSLMVQVDGEAAPRQIYSGDVFFGENVNVTSH